MKNILIIEDDKDMHRIYEDMFKTEGKKYKIEILDDATIALKRLKEEKYDLVILDIIMEPMSGDSFFVYLRENIKTTDIPVLIVSVLSPDTLVQLKKINHVQFFQKPITKEQLLKKIDEIL